MISGFRGNLNTRMFIVLLECYATSNVSYLPTGQDRLSVPYFPLISPPLTKVTTGCAEMLKTINTAEYSRSGIPQHSNSSLEESVF
jgi:hypothetical protein